MRVNENFSFFIFEKLLLIFIDFIVIHHQLLMNIIKLIHLILYQNLHRLKKFQYLFQYLFQQIIQTVKNQLHQIKQKFIDVDNVHMYRVLKYEINKIKKNFFDNSNRKIIGHIIEYISELIKFLNVQVVHL